MRNQMDKKERRLDFSIAIAFFVLLVLLSISSSLDSRSEQGTITVLPSVPKEGMPIIITLSLNNPLENEDIISYELYANGELLTSGGALLSKAATRRYTYVYKDSLKLGEKITFLLRTESSQGQETKTLSIPAYPPQVWSSFVSFASFSTSIMGSMGSSMGTSISSMQFYDSTIIGGSHLNIGLAFSLILIALLVFLELSEPISVKGLRIMGLRIRFTRLSTILFIVFAAMVLTKVVMIIG